MLSYIARKVTKLGPQGGSPSPAAMTKFFAKIDSDPEWYPGKSHQEKHGPDSVITGTNQAVVARSAMAMKDYFMEIPL